MFQDGQYRGCSAEKVHPAVIGEKMLVLAGPPGVVRVGADQLAIAASSSYSVRSPLRLSPASYAHRLPCWLWRFGDLAGARDRRVQQPGRQVPAGPGDKVSHAA